ncbi:isoprenoid synthase domain-containing protein, partial [Lactarius indigo]
MLVLATLHRLLSQVISSPGLHTAVLLTPNGQLVSYACDSTRSKDDVRLVVGLSSEIWLEVADHGIGMVDSETSPTDSANTDHVSDKPLMLIALNATESVAQAALHEPSLPLRPDPYLLLKPQLDHLRERLLNLLGSAHPTLTDIAKYYFLHPSKQLRPLLILLFSRATNGLGRDWSQKKWAADCEGAGGRTEELDRPLSRPDVLNDWNPSMPDHTASFTSVFSLVPPHPHKPPAVPASTTAGLRASDLSRTTARLSRRRPASRRFAALSRLGESEVVELIASVINNLVEGEILQMNKVAQQGAALVGSSYVGSDSWNIYLKKTYLKTASLMAKGARAAVVLGGARDGEIWKEVAYAYGRNLGIAFQLVDDVLDYESGEAALGKPGGTDLQLGLATGPALYAWEEHPEMGALIARKFEKEGDVELARGLVRRSSGVERTRELAGAYADKAFETLQHLPESEAKSALEGLTERVVKRTW